VSSPSTHQRAKSAKEVTAELFIIAISLFPLSPVALRFGWILARKFEFDRRAQVAAAFVAVLTTIWILAVGGPSAYFSAWTTLALSGLTNHPAPRLAEWIVLTVGSVGFGAPIGFAIRLVYDFMSARHPLHGPRVTAERRGRFLEVRASLGLDPHNVPLSIGGLSVLGPWLDGDEGADCRIGPWAVVPTAAHHLIVLGATGAGKSVTIERLITSALATGNRVIFVDGKEDVAAGQRLARLALDQGVDRNRIRTWPFSGPLDLWRGTQQELLDRAHSLMDWTEPYYETIAKSALRLAVSDPRGVPRSLGELISRLDSTYLKATYVGTSLAEVAAKLTQELISGVKLRYFGLDQALKAIGAVPTDDTAHGWSIDDCDFAYVSLPTSTTPVVAAGFGRAILLDVMTWLRSANRRGDDRPVLLVVEELGALIGNDDTTGRTIIEMLERARSANCRVILSGQSLHSLGSPDLAARLLHSGASTLCMRMSDPEPLLGLVGTRSQPEASLGVSVAGAYLEQGSMRIQEQFAVSPNEIRALPMGRALLFHQGRYTMAQITRVS
jgi:FtsK/SpoIIIE family